MSDRRLLGCWTRRMNNGRLTRFRGPSAEGGFLFLSTGQTPIPNEPDSSGSSLTSEFGLAVAGISSRRKSQSESTLAFQGETLGRSGSPVRANAAGYQWARSVVLGPLTSGLGR
jgi:hypothetical protein